MKIYKKAFNLNYFMKIVLSEFSHSWLLKLDPEFSHKIGIKSMQLHLFAPGKFHTPESETVLFGVKLDNPLGLAAGFDKYAEIVSYIREYGFGFIEEGSFTHRGGKGNT